ncbi:MAG: ABC transporter ATP-binding protein [Bacilli bacterium]
MAFIEVKDIRKIYGMNKENEVRALDGVSFDIKKGEFVVILGASGAGKSTILNILGGMDQATSGTYIIDKLEVTGLKDKELGRFRRKDIGFVFQFYNLIPSLNALENVVLQEVACKNQPHLNSIDALDAVGLKDRAGNFPSQLSGGEQQRVSIARAIVKKPQLLLCDEPTGALDSKTGRNVLKLLKKLAKEDKFTIIIVTHNANIAYIADHLIRVADGKVFEDLYIEKPKEVDEIEW